jgi:hypothetical protein
MVSDRLVPFMVKPNDRPMWRPWPGAAHREPRRSAMDWRRRFLPAEAAGSARFRGRLGLRVHRACSHIAGPRARVLTQNVCISVPGRPRCKAVLAVVSGQQCYGGKGLTSNNRCQDQWRAYAQKLFDEMQQQTFFTWNIVFYSCTHSGMVM